MLRADVCIIGGGAAGITIARALRGSDLDVIVLESGGFEPEDRTVALSAGEVVGEPLRWFDDALDLTTTRLRWAGVSLAPAPGSLAGLDGLQAVGHRWHASHPEDGDPDDLAAALGVDRSAGVRERLPEFAPRIREDFAAGRTVTLDGWLLAETEARLATLVWLLEGAPGPA